MRGKCVQLLEEKEAQGRSLLLQRIRAEFLIEYVFTEVKVNQTLCNTALFLAAGCCKNVHGNELLCQLTYDLPLFPHLRSVVVLPYILLTVHVDKMLQLAEKSHQS
jgi:hypothetical protein